MNPYLTAEGFENLKDLGEDRGFISELEASYNEDFLDDDYDEISQFNFLGVYFVEDKIFGDWEIVFKSGNIEEFTAPIDRDGFIAF